MFLFPDHSFSSVNTSYPVSGADTKWEMFTSPISVKQLGLYETYQRHWWIFMLRTFVSPFKMLTDFLTSLKLMCRLIMFWIMWLNWSSFPRAVTRMSMFLCVYPNNISFPHIRFLFPMPGSFLFFNTHKSYSCNKTIPFIVESLTGSARSYLEQCTHVRSWSLGVLLSS